MTTETGPSMPAALSGVQNRRRAALAAFAVLVLGGFALVGGWTGHPLAHEFVENAGRLAIVVCIVGRCWSSLYIGGRKGQELVDKGPYSMTRNPLYFFSFVGAWGFGAQTGSLAFALATLGVVWAIFRIVVAREERFLAQALGRPYVDYLARTPRFLPDPALWRGAETVTVRPRLIVATFLDGLIFLSAIPLAEGLEYLQEHGLMPVLLNLY